MASLRQRARSPGRGKTQWEARAGPHPSAGNSPPRYLPPLFLGFQCPNGEKVVLTETSTDCFTQHFPFTKEICALL